MTISKIPCPSCGQTGLRVEWRFRVAPIGSFSLAGNGIKFPATETPWLVCDCGFEEEGKR